MRDDSIHFYQIDKVGFKDSVITGLVICSHVDVGEDYCTIGWTLLLKGQWPLKRSVIDFMNRSLLLLFNTLRDGSSRHIDDDDLIHPTLKLVSTRPRNEISFKAFQFLQHDTRFCKVVIIYTCWLLITSVSWQTMFVAR
jgi:hypothetical protein